MPTATVRSRNDDEVAPVLPGDHAGIERVEQWLQAFAVSGDPALREQIVLAYLGLADRLADRYRSSRGTTREDLIQTAGPPWSPRSTATTRPGSAGLYPSRSPAWSAS